MTSSASSVEKASLATSRRRWRPPSSSSWFNGTPSDVPPPTGIWSVSESEGSVHGGCTGGSAGVTGSAPSTTLPVNVTGARPTRRTTTFTVSRHSQRLPLKTVESARRRYTAPTPPALRSVLPDTVVEMTGPPLPSTSSAGPRAEMSLPSTCTPRSDRTWGSGRMGMGLMRKSSSAERTSENAASR